MTCISLSQSASNELDSRLRFRRQAVDDVTCPEGKKPCKDDNTKCATYCDANPECADVSDELDCATSASATIENENDRVNAPQVTTDLAEATLPQISIFDQQTNPSAATGATTSADGNAVTTGLDADAATVILPDGTTIVLPPGTTATINAADDSATTAADADSAATAADGDSATTVADADSATAAGTAATVVDGGSETSTIIIVDNGTDVFTTIQPGNGHATDEAANDTSADATKISDVTALDLTTVDSNVTDIADVRETTQSLDRKTWGTTIGTNRMNPILNSMVCARTTSQE
ncbi:unnamed protein product [Adineta ricciae]|uniref:Uncharacterized protein n=1 Tax=Adineta ricciae TaxID=249248 RepID=A0A813X9Q5_ADIRI|nr:unnamed protein product [Adineta ricciae]